MTSQDKQPVLYKEGDKLGEEANENDRRLSRVKVGELGVGLEEFEKEFNLPARANERKSLVSRKGVGVKVGHQESKVA